MNMLVLIKQLKRPVFTTHELASVSGKSLSAVTQALNYLEHQGLIFKIYRGVWAEEGNESLSPYLVIPFLFPRHRAYVSFISALHLHGIIEQIPQVIMLASTSHTRIIRTKLGVFMIHQISPKFFKGFGWYRDDGNFLIAQPEKALVDCLYLSSRRKKQFGYFPETRFSRRFSFKKAKKWAALIPDSKIRAYVQKKLSEMKKNIYKHGLYGVVIALFFLALSNNFAHSNQDTASVITRAQEIIDKEKALREKIDKNEKIYLKKVIVKGTTLVDRERIKEILLPFKNHWISGNDIKIIMDSIAGLYKEKGYSDSIEGISYKTIRNTLSITVKEKNRRAAKASFRVFTPHAL